jgi:hypothetical protein
MPAGTDNTRRPLCDPGRVVDVTDALLGAVAGVAVGSRWDTAWPRMATHQFVERDR